MNTLRIYFSGLWRDASSPCPWALCDGNGAVLQSGNDPLAALPKAAECIAIAAADRVLFTSAKLPPGSRRKWEAALPFAAEEHTLNDPEDNHTVPGPTLADGRTVLAVVDKPWLGRIVEACRAANLPVRRMIPETLLPTPGRMTGTSLQQAWMPDIWVLIWDGLSGFLRTGHASGMALDEGDAMTAPLGLHLCLEAAQANSSSPAPGKIEVCFPKHIPEAQRSLPQWNSLPVALAAGPEWDWRRAPIPDNALNLLWGEFAPRLRVREWWPKWRPFAWILLAALGIEILGANIEWALLASEKNKLTREMEQSFRAAFGDSAAIVNAPLQMRRNLAGLRHAAGLSDASDFLPLIDAAAIPLSALPAGSVRGLHYDAGRLDLEIALDRKEDFRALQQRLQDRGLRVRIGDIRETGSKAQARLTVMPGGEQ